MKKLLVVSALGIMALSGLVFSAVRRPMLEIHGASQ